MLATLVAGLLATAVPAGDICLYPDAPDFPLTRQTNNHLNPRFPEVPPQEGGSRGRCFPAQLILFNYSFGQYVRFPEGGRLSMAVRDTPHPAGQFFFSLSDSTHSLKLIRDDLGKDLQVRFVYAKASEDLVSVDLTSFAPEWSTVELRWDKAGATLYREGKAVAEAALTAPFDPVKLELWGWPVDELQLVGDGQLSLDWENGYAARIKLRAEADARLIPRLFGFDSHVISLDPAKRDCPMVQLINTGPDDRPAVISFGLKSEVTAQSHEWRQEATVPARSESMITIRFPFDVQTDIYHLTVRTFETTPPLDDSKHFMYVRLRGEPAGPAKFGLHDSGPRVVGGWPDALPIHLAAKYVAWFMTQGPPYAPWWNDKPGMDPDLPPENWYWRPKIDRAFYAGRRVYVCVQGTPAKPWMRAKEYGKSVPRRPLGGDYVGGVPNQERYRRYLRALATRYKGKVAFYEVENEPNAMGYTHLRPEDYVQTCKAVYEEVKAIDPDVRVFGICGTGDFAGYMQEVFKRGGHRYMDGVSWHTYIGFFSGQVMPHEVDLAGKLAAARKVMAATGKELAIINSETGLKFANRVEIDQPMSEERLRRLNLKDNDTWPHYGMTEQRGGACYVENVIVNFLAGAEYFTIFGWNPVWSDPKAGPGKVWYGWFVGAHEENRRTPGHHTLALGVLTAQMEPAIHTQGRTIDRDGVQGGVFPKTDGGELAVLWSTGGARTAFIQSANPTIEHVSMLGQSSILAGRKSQGAYTYTLNLGEEPCYIHSAGPLGRLLPSPMRSVAVEPGSAGRGRIRLTMANVFAEPWQGRIAFNKDAGWRMVPAEQDFTLEPGEQRALQFAYVVDANVPRGRHPRALTIRLPGGTTFLSAVSVPIMPLFCIPRLPAACSTAELHTWRPPGGSLLLDQRDQVVLGRPPDLASLEEKGTWAGPAELSAEAKIGYDENGLAVYVKVHDAHPSLPGDWPGVRGSCVELFFDFRPEGKGLGQVSYDGAVHQIVVRPVIEQAQEPAVWHASRPSDALPNLSVEAGALDGRNYWIVLRLPSSDIGEALRPGRRIGFDVGINGPHADGSGRKTQIMMFGGPDNYSNASGFGQGVLAGAPTIDSITVSPSPAVAGETVVTVTVEAVPADPGDVLAYKLWAKNGSFTEWAPLYAASAVEYFPPPLVPGPGKVRVPSDWNEWSDADGILTFTADAVPGSYELGCGVTVVSGPNTKAHTRSTFPLTITPLAQPTDSATRAKTESPHPAFDIVVGEDAIPSELYAAKEFRRFFAKASGTALPIVTKTSRRDRHVFIGPSAALHESNVGFGVEGMGPEDLRIVVRDGNVAIAGGRPRGTLYGVYTFLEDRLGVRFLTHDHTHVPSLEIWPVRGPVDKTFRPPLDFRECSYREMHASPVLAARLRCNTIPRHAKFGGTTGRRLINHSFASQLPTKTYGREHPEYYALVDGKRQAPVPRDMDWRYTQPCLTNPDVLAVVTQSVLAGIRRHPAYTNVSVSQNDNHSYCRCPQCAAIDAREGSPMGSLLTFVNAVADRVAEAAPGIKVGTLAYAYSRKPPRTVKPRPNVQIQLCALEASVTKPVADPESQRNAAFREDLEAWGRVCDDICLWYYNVNFYDYHLPNPNLRVLEPNIRFFVANGVRGILMQAAYTSLGTEFSDLRNYVTCRLLWDPQLSGQLLIDEFLDLHYGNAAPPIRRFINLVHDNCEAKGLDTPFDGKWEQFGIDDSIVEAGLEAFDEALRLAEDDLVRARVEKASICAYRIAIEDAYTWDDKKGPLPPAVAGRTRPYVKRLFDLCDKYGVTNMTEGLTVDKRQDPNRPFPGYRPIIRKRFGLKEGEPF